MKNLVKIAFLSMVAMYSQVSFAEPCSQNNNTLSGLVGLDSSSGTIYAVISSNTNECSCTTVRFTEGNTDTKSALSILLAAKMANKLVRIDLLDKTSCNTAYRVYIQ